MAHLPHAPQDKLDEVSEELAFAAAIMGFEPNSFKIMAHRPEILRGFLALSAAVLGPESQLDPGLRQMIAYIASAAAGCNYCQAHTSHGAHARGVSSEKIEALWLYETSPLFSDAERAALQLSQSAASVPNQATQAHFDAAKAHFDEAQVAEIIAVVATFGFLNRWNDSLATDIEDNPLAFAETHLAATDWTPPRNK
jgi:uncharacterized peroxidase-related enzyme